MRGIIFTPDNHQAIRDKLKAQTRRVIKELQEPDSWFFIERKEGGLFLFGNKNGQSFLIKPRFRVGETVYIKEAWATKNQYNNLKPSEVPHTAKLFYMLTDGYYPFTMGIRRSPMFMPEWVARDFIKITDVRAERLHKITEEDAIAEGINPAIKEHDSSIDLRLKFAWLWNSINGKNYPFDGDYWVWRICFKEVKESD